MEAQDICTPGKEVPTDNISRSRQPGPANFHRHQKRRILNRFVWRTSGSSAVIFPSLQGILSARWRKLSNSVAPPTRRLREPADKSCAYKMSTRAHVENCLELAPSSHEERSAASPHKQASTTVTPPVPKS